MYPSCSGRSCPTAEEAKALPGREFGSVILRAAAVKAEGSPEACRDEPSCGFVMKGEQKEHPSAEIVVRILESPRQAAGSLCRLIPDPAPSQKQGTQNTASTVFYLKWANEIHSLKTPPARPPTQQECEDKDPAKIFSPFILWS